MITAGELLALIAMWCEQTHVDLWSLHQCRQEVLACAVAQKKPSDKELLKCFMKSKEPEAEAT